MIAAMFSERTDLFCEETPRSVARLPSFVSKPEARGVVVLNYSPDVTSAPQDYLED
jgi:hypothetical protein